MDIGLKIFIMSGAKIENKGEIFRKQKYTVQT